MMRRYMQIVENAQPYDPNHEAPSNAAESVIYDLFHEGMVGYTDGGGMNVDVVNPNTVYLSRIWSNQPGSGHGSKLLRALCAACDEAHVGIELEVGPDAEGPLDEAALVAWYDRYGFELDSEKSSLQGVNIMVREPQ